MEGIVILSHVYFVRVEVLVRVQLEGMLREL